MSIVEMLGNAHGDTGNRKKQVSLAVTIAIFALLCRSFLSDPALPEIESEPIEFDANTQPDKIAYSDDGKIAITAGSNGVGKPDSVEFWSLDDSRLIWTLTPPVDPSFWEARGLTLIKDGSAALVQWGESRLELARCSDRRQIILIDEDFAVIVGFSFDPVRGEAVIVASEVFVPDGQAGPRKLAIVRVDVETGRRLGSHSIFVQGLPVGVSARCNYAHILTNQVRQDVDLDTGKAISTTGLGSRIIFSKEEEAVILAEGRVEVVGLDGGGVLDRFSLPAGFNEGSVLHFHPKRKLILFQAYLDRTVGIVFDVALNRAVGRLKIPDSDFAFDGAEFSRSGDRVIGRTVRGLNLDNVEGSQLRLWEIPDVWGSKVRAER